MVPAGRRKDGENPQMKTPEESLKDGAVKHVDLVCQETGLSRADLLNRPGIKYRHKNDMVAFGETARPGFRDVKREAKP